jgi:hypothetical protein
VPASGLSEGLVLDSPVVVVETEQRLASVDEDRCVRLGVSAHASDTNPEDTMTNVWLRRVLLVAPPLVLAVVLLWHPPGGDDVYEGVRNDVEAWMLVHTVFLIFIPLLGLAGFLLVSGLTGRAATVSRVGLLLFLVFYTAYEVTVGVGTGILGRLRQRIAGCRAGRRGRCDSALQPE